MTGQVSTSVVKFSHKFQFRDGQYVDGAHTGAPQTTQVAARFHLLQNLAEALDQAFSTSGKALKTESHVQSHTLIVQAAWPGRRLQEDATRGEVLIPHTPAGISGELEIAF